MYVHCNECHHEWECTSDIDRKCDWCGGDSYILENDLDTISIDIDDVITRLKKLNNPYANKVIEKINKNKKK